MENAIDEKKNNVEEEESNGNLDEKQLEGDDGVEEKALEVNTVSFIQELHQWCNG